MSTSEPFDEVAESWTQEDAALTSAAPGAPGPIVPGDSITGRSLTAVVAIMTFVAVLASGAAMLVADEASDWQLELERDVTIQVRAVAGHDLETDVNAAAAIARPTAGVADTRVFTRQESA